MSQRLCLEPVGCLIIAHLSNELLGKVGFDLGTLCIVLVVSHRTRPPKVLVEGPVHLDPRHNNVLGGFGRRHLCRSLDRFQDAIVRRICHADKVRGLVPVGGLEFCSDLRSHQRHFSIRGVELEAHVGAAAQLVVKRNQRSTCAGYRLTSRSPNFPHRRVVRAIRNVRGNPENVTFLSCVVLLRGVGHACSEASLAAENKACQRGDVEGLPPQAVELFGKRAADFVAAGRDQVNRV
mmetsp:Transcript_90389/g.132258  ORF Transcript_90389/g.132258 Transcript_90389/m.132258 type:complete len:236 (-) Transcript_90389:382-1089(-)